MIEEQYICHRCGSKFIVCQKSAGKDEDINLCWDCIDHLLTGSKRAREVIKEGDAAIAAYLLNENIEDIKRVMGS